MIDHDATPHSASISLDTETRALFYTNTAKAILGNISDQALTSALQALCNLNTEGRFNALLIIDGNSALPVSVQRTARSIKVELLNCSLLEYAFGIAYKHKNQAVAVFNRDGQCLEKSEAFNALMLSGNDTHEPFNLQEILSTQGDKPVHSTLCINHAEYVATSGSIEPSHQLWGVSIELTGKGCDNIEALRVAKVQAEQASEAKGRFLATMSHEIRSPLNAIINMAELLLNTPLTPKQKQYASVAYSGGQTLLALINDILDFSKIEAGHLTLNEDAFDLVATLEDLTTLFWTRAHESHLELCLTINPNISGHYLGDEQRIRQILINLINNAIKFTEKGGVTIALDEAPDQEGIVITVTDTGIGMTPDEAQSVFQAFVQAQSSESRQYSGTGLGLAIVQQLTDIMDGDISVTSTLGLGSVFRLALPLQKVLSGQNAVNLLPKTATAGHWLAIIDTANQALSQALTQQNAYYGIRTFNFRDIDEPIIGQFEQVFIFGEADESSQNIQRYHAFADTFIHSKVVNFTALSDLHCSEALKEKLLRGYSNALDRPILPSMLRQYYFEAPAEHHAAHSIAPQTHTTILLVDDGETNRAVASALLEQIGVASDVAVNGKDALEKAEKKRYPLILMDLAMPIMDGLEATSHIRAGSSPNKETPIVALTANAFAEDRSACLTAGMNDYLSKPINSDIFFQKVQHWLHQAPTPKNEKNKNSDKNETQTDTRDQAINNESDILDGRVLQQLIKDTSAHSLKVILDIYCKEVEERIPQMELLLSQEIWSTLADEAHILKGSSASFGAIELSARAKIIELGVRAGEYGQVRDAMQNIAPLAAVTLNTQREFLAQAIQQ